MLSKSRFIAGWQCHRLLWWKVHEPGAKELEPGKVLQDLFDQGRHAGELARTRFAGGVLIDLPHHAREERVAATRRAIENGAPAIFEASFIHDDTYVAVDVLLREGDGWRIIEVKSSSEQKPEHIPDVSVQAYVAAANGLHITGIAVMHLSRDFRHPDTGELFARTDVAAPVAAFVGMVPEEIARQHEMLAGPLPAVEIGGHCLEPHECPFKKRCWPNDPHHISQLYNVGAKRLPSYLHRGIHSLKDLPQTEKLNAIQKRQLKAVAENRMIVEPGLKAALEPFMSPLSRRARPERSEGERGLGGIDVYNRHPSIIFSQKQGGVALKNAIGFLYLKYTS